MLFFLIEVLLALVLCFLVTSFLRQRWAIRRLPPGPTPLPVLGNLWALDFKFEHQKLNQFSKTYGNIFTVWMGGSPVVVLHGYQTVRDALTSHSEELSGRPSTALAMDIMGNKGIVFSNGHIWKQQRRFGLMSLRNLGLGKKSLEAWIQDVAQDLLGYFSLQKGKPIDPAPAILSSVSNVICSVVFGHCFAIDDHTFRELVNTVKLLFASRSKIWSRLYDAFPFLMRRFPVFYGELFDSWDKLRSVMKQEIRTHQENTSDEPRDLIDLYLAQISQTKGDPSSTYDEESLVQVVVDLFVAGSETTTTTLLWGLNYMANRPEIQEKVQKELDAVLGESRIGRYEDRNRLPYTNAVIHEIQRYSTILPFGVSRKCVKDTTLQGFHIKKGTIVVPNLFSVLFDPAHWETPQQFNPGHFLDKDGNFVAREAFLPFSAGHRVCLGETLARTELFIFLTSLLRAFTFRPPEGVKKLNEDFIYAATLQPHPYQICAVPR